jgi:hypothetical protein
MSKSVKIHDAVRKWDAYALFDKDNVLACDYLFTRIEDAEPLKNHLIGFRDPDSVSIWNVTLTRKDKVNDHNAVKIQPCG